MILVSAISLIVDAGRAWNGLAFSGFGDRLVTFIIFSVSFLVFSASESLSDKLFLRILAVAVLVLIAPTVMGCFVPKYQPPTPVPTPPTPRPRVQCAVCRGTGTVYCTTCNGTGTTYEYKSTVRFTPLQPGESSMMKFLTHA